MGINRKNIYRESVLEKKDMVLADKITKIHKAHPAYGQKRVAWELNINHKRASRVMSKFFGIKPPRRKSKKHWITVSTSAHNYTNLIKGVVADRSNFIFVSDLTYIKFQGKFIYLAEECWTYLQGR